jgi:cold shock CspA family protein
METTKVKLTHGVITNWQNDRGFGFVRSDDGVDYFCHIKTLQRNNVYEPATSDRLLFEAVKSERRPGAYEVGGHVERLNPDGSRRAEAPRPARPPTLREAHEREEAAFARLAFVKGPR